MKFRKNEGSANRIFQMAIYLAGAVFIFGVHFFSGIRQYYHDAYVYWSYGEMYGLEKFSLLNYNSSLRGYLFPLFIYMIRKLAFEGLGTERMIFCIITSLLYAFFFMVLIPRVIELMFQINIPMGVRLIYAMICTVMFRGLIVYPLTDLSAIMLACAAMYFFLLLAQDKVKVVWKQVLYAIGMGLALGGAYYVRPIYLIVWIAVGGMSFIIMCRKKKWIFLFAFLGMLIVAMPQIYINQKHFETYSPMIQTHLNSDESMSLYLNQLRWGIYMQKYETNVDVTVSDIQPGMVFRDAIGETLLERDKVYSYPRYLLFCIRHFGDMACIYLKHIFNGLDIVYPSVYIQKIYCNRFAVQLLNYTLIFAGLKGIVFFVKKKCWNSLTVGMSIAYVLPILLVIPTAVETRFFVGAHLMLYLFGITALMNREWWYKVLQCRWKTAGAYVLFLGGCFLLNSQTFNCYGIPLW